MTVVVSVDRMRLIREPFFVKVVALVAAVVVACVFILPDEQLATFLGELLKQIVITLLRRRFTCFYGLSIPESFFTGT